MKLDLSSFIRSEWHKAFEDSFQFLNQIPSSAVRSRTAVIAEQQDIFPENFMAELAIDPLAVDQNRRNLINAMVSKERSKWHLYDSIGDIHLRVKYGLPASTNEQYKSQLERLRNVYKDVKTPSASETRQAFFPKLKDLLGSKARNCGGGVWSFSVPVADRKIELNLDFGGLHTGFKHWFDLFPDRKPDTIAFASYEECLGFYYCCWDLMQDRELDNHAETFVEVVTRTLNALREVC